MILTDWALQWGIPAAAIFDLQSRVLGLDGSPPEADLGVSEASVLNRVRLRASAIGMRTWRNNVGAGYSEDGSFMRWGLANETAAVNKSVKSADLIGIKPWIIQPNDVGKLIGQFVSYEVKHAGWTFKGDERETAQLNWANLILSLGGDARFITSASQL